MRIQAEHRLRLIIRRVDYFATFVYLYCLYFQDGFLGVAKHFVLQYGGGFEMRGIRLYKVNKKSLCT
jgi:hypothetical protein